MFEGGGALMQSAHDPKGEAVMTYIHERKTDRLGASFVRGIFSLPVRIGRWTLNFMKEAFQPRYDFNRLDPRLRRDAGIDELELERTSAIKAPLIR